MSELDDSLNSILSNPQMMQQIMNLAQSLNTSAPAQPQGQPQFPPQSNMNPHMLNRISSLMQRGAIDSEQKNLLKALSPYLSGTKIQKLERAMYAAKMAGIASEMLNGRNQNTFSGR